MSSQAVSNKNAQLSRKAKLKQSSKPILISSISCGQDSNFFIVIDTPIKKQQYNHIYGDRVEKILNEVHRFYFKSQQKGQAQKFNSTKDELAKTIKVNLGDKQILQNDARLMQQTFPKIDEFAEYRGKQTQKYNHLIQFEVKWKNSQTVSIVSRIYLKENEPRLYDGYDNTRKEFQSKFKAYKKQIYKTSSFQKDTTRKIYKVDRFATITKKQNSIPKQKVLGDFSFGKKQFYSSESDSEISELITTLNERKKMLNFKQMPFQKFKQEQLSEDQFENSLNLSQKSLKRQSSYENPSTRQQTQSCSRKSIKIQQKKRQDQNSETKPSKKIIISRREQTQQKQQKILLEPNEAEKYKISSYSFYSNPAIKKAILQSESQQEKITLQEPYTQRRHSFLSKPSQLQDKSQYFIENKQKCLPFFGKSEKNNANAGSPTISLKSEETLSGSQQKFSENKRSGDEQKDKVILNYMRNIISTKNSNHEHSYKSTTGSNYSYKQQNSKNVKNDSIPKEQQLNKKSIAIGPSKALPNNKSIKIPIVIEIDDDDQ